MSGRPPRSHRRISAMLRAPMAWIALALLILIVAATTAVGVELYSNTSEPMVVNPR